MGRGLHEPAERSAETKPSPSPSLFVPIWWFSKIGDPNIVP